MTSRWYCKFCNCYLADNKPSRLHHENGARHRQRVQESLKAKKDAAREKLQQENELRNALAAADRAALVAVHGENVYSHLGIPPPPPPIRFTAKKDNQEAPKVKEEIIDETEDTDEAYNGIYIIDDVTYVDGETFPNYISLDRTLEIFVEALDEWFHVVELTSRALPAHIDPQWDVVYEMADIEGVPHRVYESAILSNRFRAILAKGEVDPVTLAAQEAAAAVPIINESTGFSGWQTVSVRTVDVEKEREESDKAQEEMRKGTFMMEDGKATEDAFVAKAAARAVRNVDMSAALRGSQMMDTYKGFRVDDGPKEAVFSEIREGEEDEDVTFKSRTIIKSEDSSAGTAKRRNYRRK